jgi:tetratricopeptide (TPR) repeat protein
MQHKSYVVVFWFLFLVCCAGNNGHAQEPDASDLREMGVREYTRGNYERAESRFRAALAASGMDEELSAEIHTDLGMLFVDEERLGEAEHAYTIALGIQKRHGDNQASAFVLRELGAVYSAQHRDEEAIAALTRALKLTKNLPRNLEFTATILNGLGVAYFQRGNFKKANRMFQEGLNALPNTGSTEALASLLNNVGAVYYLAGDLGRAEDSLKGSLDLITDQLGPSHPALTKTSCGSSIGGSSPESPRCCGNSRRLLADISCSGKNR